MSLYAIVVSAEHIDPPHYWPTVPGNSTTDAGSARKFSTPGDATAFLQTHGIDEGAMRIVRLDDAALVDAEAKAQFAWNHRDCHNGRAA